MARRGAKTRGEGETSGGEAAGGPPSVAAPLLSLPPQEFLAARDALARQLSETGDPAAAAVRKLRRPSGLAWVLNRLARTEPKQAEDLRAAGDRLRAVQAAAFAGSGGPAPLREAEQQLRDAARALRLTAAAAWPDARRSTPQQWSHLELLLRTLAVAPDEVRERFARGLLDREPELAADAVGFDGLAPPQAPVHGAPPAAMPAREEAAKRAAHEDRVRAAEAERERRRAEEARRRAEAEARAQERARLAAEAERAAAAEAAARRAVAEAERHLEHERAQLQEAQRQLDGARAELENAEAEARSRRERLDTLGETRAGPGAPEPA